MEVVLNVKIHSYTVGLTVCHYCFKYLQLKHEKNVEGLYLNGK